MKKNGVCWLRQNILPMNTGYTNRISKKIKAILLFALFSVMFAYVFISFDASHALFAKIVRAAATFNTDPEDFETLRSSNFTKFPNSTTNWAVTTDAEAGDVVSFTIYYHNTSSEDALNVRASISVPESEDTSISADGSLWADNASQVDGQSSIIISSSESLTYIPGSTKWYPDQSLSSKKFPFGQTGDEFVTSQGVNLGTIAPGWESQGSVVARFKVSSNNVPSNDPTVDIKANGSQGPITLSQGENLLIEWDSTNTQSCSLGAPIDSNVNLSDEMDLSPSHPFYPTDTAVTYSISCDDGNGKTATDSVVVNPPIVNPPGSPTADITANGSQGPLLLSSGEQFTVNWVSTNTTSCNLSIQGVQDLGLVALNGSAGPIDSQSPFYPPTNGSHTFLIDCQDASGQHATDSVVVTRVQGPSCPLPAIDSALTASGKVGNAFSYTLSATATGTTTPITYNIATSTLPAGLSVSSNVLSGTPTESGTFTVLLTATNQCGSDTETLTIVIDPEDNGGGGGGKPQSPNLSANTGSQCGGRIDLSWNAVSQASFYKIFRNGSEIASTTAISYTDLVNASTSFSYFVKATNSRGDSNPSNTVTATSSTDCLPQSPTADITANGSQGPLLLSSGEQFTVNWVSTNTTSCNLSIQGVQDLGLVALNGSAGPIDSQSPFYPPTNGSHTFLIDCQDASGQHATDSVVVTRVQGPSCPLPAIDSALTASGKVGNAFSYTLSATATGTTTPITYNIATSTLPAGLSVSSNVLSGTPTESGTFTVLLTATNQCGSDTETLTIVIDPEDNGGGGGGDNGGGGGGGGGGRSSRNRPEPEVLGATLACNYLEDYMRIDWVNDSFEVIKLQVFLRELEGFKNLPITGVFDKGTYDAVGVFQERYIGDILTPWGHDQSTGFVYILTKKKVNEIVCNQAFPLNAQQEQEIVDFRNFLTSLKAQGFSDLDRGYQGQNNYQGQDTSQSRTKESPILSQKGIQFATGAIVAEDPNSVAMISASSTENEIGEERDFRSLAAAVFAGPQGWDESMNAIAVFLTILLSIYLLSRGIVNFQNRNGALTEESAQIRKTFIFTIGLVIATVLIFVLEFYVIILPLILLIIIVSASLFWLISRKKEIRTIIKIEENNLS